MGVEGGRVLDKAVYDLYHTQVMLRGISALGGSDGILRRSVVTRGS